MRTLVVSDLHLGLRCGRDLLRDADRRTRLLQALGDVDRLVLLGDLLELRQGPVRDALGAAAPVLTEIGEALGAGRQVVVVPGNHDHHLLHAWLQRTARGGPPPPLGLDSAVDWRAGEPLGAVARALGPVDVEARYPGVWLRDGVYAIHGHYSDRHTTIPMFERLGAGAMARLLGQPAAEARGAEDYEAVLGPIYAWLHAVAQGGGPDRRRSSTGESAGASARLWRELRRGTRRGGWRRRALMMGFPVGIAALNRAGLGPLTRDIDGAALRRAPLLALDEVLRCLGIDAESVIFGHTHRAGPLPSDNPGEWRSATGTRLLNTGSWTHEPVFLGRDPRSSPYRPGFAVSLSDPGPPELVNLLD
ncbi:MAG: metallophosphoesterase [Actinomycetota bacterium]|nr:metallophosphoesterase [Actinomycetota bacterium]